MLLKGILLGKVVNVLTTKSTVGDLRLLEILSLEEELIIAVLEAGLKFANLS